MIFNNVQTWYITGASNQRLIRYDIIFMDDDTYLVKVIDEQQQGIANPKVLIEIDQFELTRQTYTDEYEIGQNRNVRNNTHPTFESYPEIKCQDHRNKLD